MSAARITCDRTAVTFSTSTPDLLFYEVDDVQQHKRQIGFPGMQSRKCSTMANDVGAHVGMLQVVQLGQRPSVGAGCPAAVPGASLRCSTRWGVKPVELSDDGCRRTARKQALVGFRIRLRTLSASHAFQNTTRRQTANMTSTCLAREKWTERSWHSLFLDMGLPDTCRGR